MQNEVVNPDKVWVSVERTVNLGNYENIKIQAGASRSLKPGDDAEEEALILLDEFEQLIDKRAARRR